MTDTWQTLECRWPSLSPSQVTTENNTDEVSIVLDEVKVKHEKCFYQY